MQTLYVTYPGDATTRFDRKYYVDSHLPLVMKSWRQYGLESVAAFFPEGSGEGTIAICACSFRDQQAIQGALTSPEVSEVMADLPHFTDAQPSRSIFVPIAGAVDC